MNSLYLFSSFVLAASLSELSLLAQNPALDQQTTTALRAKAAQIREELERVESELAVRQSPPKSKASATEQGETLTPASDAVPPAKKSGIIKQVMLRKSVFDQKIIGEPAEITYVRPGSGNESYAIDAGLSVEFEALFLNSTFPITIAPRIGVEYHRNSALNALTDQLQAGLQFESVLGNAGAPFGAILNGSASFKNDNVVDTQSVEATLELLPLLPWLGTDDFHDVGPARFRWQPFLGLLYESSFETGDAAKKGSRLVGRYGAEFTLWPFYKQMQERVELRASYTAWSSLDSNGVYGGNDWNAFFEAGLTYWFSLPNPAPGRLTMDKIAMGIGLTYQNGDHLELGLEDQDLLTLSFQAKF